MMLVISWLGVERPAGPTLMVGRAGVLISWRPRAVTPSRVHTASANRSPSPAMSASSLRNAYDEIRFSMARSLETEPWFPVDTVVLSCEVTTLHGGQPRTVVTG